MIVPIQKHIKQSKDYDCGYACLEMVAEIPFDEAVKVKPYTEKGPKRGLKIREMKRISQNAGDDTIVFKGTRGTKLLVGKGDTTRNLGKQLEKFLRDSNFSLLIFIKFKKESDIPQVKHWILYDAGTSKVYDPQCSEPMGIEDYIKAKSDKFQEIRFYRILKRNKN